MMNSNMWPDLGKPSVWDPCAILTIRVFGTSGQKLSNFRFCHIHVKEPSDRYRCLWRLSISYQGELSLSLHAPQFIQSVQLLCSVAKHNN